MTPDPSCRARLTRMASSLRAALVFSSVLLPHHLRAQQVLDTLAISVTDSSREFIYTNKQTAFYFGETGDRNKSSWQGFNVGGIEVLDDYQLLIDGAPLERKDVLKAVVYPDRLLREYPGGIREEFILVDSLPLFIVSVTSQIPVEVTFVPYLPTPLLTNAGNGQLRSDSVRLKDGLLMVDLSDAKPDRLSPRRLVVRADGFAPARHIARRDGSVSPGFLVSGKGRFHAICVAADAEAERLSLHGLVNRHRLRQAKRERMERLLEASPVVTGHTRFNRALAWARISLDNLIMHQGGKGIFAGLPWFNNYWGRDTFISLPALVVTGLFTDARDILRTFSAVQEIDSASTSYGRIPNTIDRESRSYNTADATPRFVMMAREYVERSGDSVFLREVYPAVIRSMEGTLRYHTDSLGFLTHEDAETWMDAVGPDGPWSPRGNRANDVQSLWAGQLEAGIWFATQLGDAASAREWDQHLQRLRGSFAARFITPDGVTDHLNRDGSKDKQVRPNQIFVARLLDEHTRAAVTRTVLESLTYPYGVASLSPTDSAFHPFHEYPPFYPKDAAYHNGTVWTWLQGPLISELCHFRQHQTAFTLTESSVDQLLDVAAVGTQSELLDAVPRPGETLPRPSGTASQAWNLAEFIRNFYDDYLGVRISLYDGRLTLCPRIPEELGTVEATVNLEGRKVRVRVDPSPAGYDVVINEEEMDRDLDAVVDIPVAGGLRRVSFVLKSGDITTIKASIGSVNIASAGSAIPFTTSPIGQRIDPAFFNGLTFVPPSLPPDLPALKPPPYSLLGHHELKTLNHSATVVFDTADPSGDDTGSGTYTYPQNNHFLPGCLDILNFRMGYDTSHAYFSLRFRTLSNPGWHPEYGFQLTYAAIAIDMDGLVGRGNTGVGYNSNYLLPDGRGYERLILVGGGLRVEDQSGRILAAYAPGPSDISDPLGNADEGTISFALPFTLLGKPENAWKITVITGAQDDHGGAGLGEFRTVSRVAGEWTGGGRESPDEPNVYDVLEATSRRNRGHD